MTACFSVNSHVAQTEGELCWGAPGEDLLGDQLSTRGLHHDVGEREENTAQVVLGRLAAQERAKLLLHAPAADIRAPCSKLSARGASSRNPHRESAMGSVQIGPDRGADLLQSALQVDVPSAT